MINWWLVVIVVLIAVLFLKFQDLKHKLGITLMILLVLLLALSMVSVYTTNDLDLSNLNGVAHAGKVYLSWLLTFGNNIVKVSGYAVGQDWGFDLKNVTLIK